MSVEAAKTAVAEGNAPSGEVPQSFKHIKEANRRCLQLCCRLNNPDTGSNQQEHENKQPGVWIIFAPERHRREIFYRAKE